MKPLALNLSKMKKVSGDEKSSTFLHPDGHKMVIAHHAISALQRKQIEGMEVHKLAEGTPDGPIENSSRPKNVDEQLGLPAPNPFEAAVEQRMQSLRNQDPRYADEVQIRKQAEGEIHAKEAKEKEDADFVAENKAKALAYDEKRRGITHGEPAPPAPAGAPVQGPAPASLPGQSSPELPSVQANPYMQGAPGFDANKSYAQGLRGISEQQAVSAAKAAKEADIQSKDLALRQQVQDDFQKTHEQFSAQQQHFMKDYMANRVNPNHYVENMGTGQKVATAIGLLLGGMSAKGNSNPAMEFLNSQIERDIAAQKARMDQQKTILGANHEYFGDMVAAENQTRINLNDIYAHKIQLAASQLGTPQAKAIADMAAADWGMKNAELMQKNSARAALSLASRNPNVDPATYMRLVQQVDPAKGKELQETYVPGMGFANTPKDAETMKELSGDANAARNSIARLKAINRISGKSLNPSLRTEASGLVNGLIGQLNRPFTGGGPMSEGERKVIEELARNPTKLFSLDSSSKTALETLERMLNSKVEEAAKARGLNAHITPPEEVQTRGGVQYKKVAGGWQKVQ